MNERELIHVVTISHGNTEVRLLAKDTRVTGPEYITWGVAENWAKFRRTKDWPFASSRIAFYICSLIATLVVFLFTLSFTLDWISQSIDKEGKISAAMIGFGTFVLFATIGINLVRRGVGGAVMHPGNGKERRADRQFRTRHNMQVALTTILGSVVIPAAAIIPRIIWH